MQHLRDGKEDQPETEHGRKDAQDEHGGHLLIVRAGAAVVGIGLADGISAATLVSGRADAEPGAEGRHEQKRNPHDDPDIEHAIVSFDVCLDAIPALGTLN
jgi:hypothetical protein